ncbi:MAG TPA: TonB-dependent receptor plug domain-containing protein, partial [Vicinamibacterales bacterium]|nr:TonB-dependent receptor plug domain-containing protein [Vicinamibacterales bacterium]
MTALVLALTMALTVPATLSGSVTAADGTPVAGATVVVRQADGDVSEVTDGAGRFAFADVTLPAVVTVIAGGFAPSSRVVEAGPADFRLAPASLVESVVVPADRAPAWRDPETGATILTAGELATLPALTIDEALRIIPGFSLFRRSSSRQSNPTTHGVTMRGLSASGASRGLVLMDGVPLNDGFGGWVTWTRVPALAIDRLDLTRAAAGDAFGSDAVGGVLQIVPPTGGMRSWEAALETGSLDLVALDGSAGGRLGPWAVFGAASWLSTSGSIPVEPDARGPVDQEADAEWASAFGTAARAWGGRRLTVSGWGGRDDRGNGTVLQRNRMSGGTAAGRFDAIGRETTFGARWSMSPNTFDQTFTFANATRSLETLTSTQTTDTLTTAGVVEVGRTLARAHLVGRAELSRASADVVDGRAAATGDRSLA